MRSVSAISKMVKPTQNLVHPSPFSIEPAHKHVHSKTEEEKTLNPYYEGKTITQI